MKRIFLIIPILAFAFSSCKNENVKAPSAEYNIQSLDKIQNEYFNLDRPYILKMNTEYRVISENNGEYNSFFMGDSVKSNNKWTYHIYSEQPKSNHQGLALKYNLELQKSIATIKYPLAGKYQVTFVAAASGDDGNMVEFAVNSKDSVTIIP